MNGHQLVAHTLSSLGVSHIYGLYGGSIRQTIPACSQAGIRAIGVNDNFFDLEAHSLLATKVIARLRRVFELSIPLKAIFEHPTIAELAHAIDTQLPDTFQEGPTNDRPTPS